MTRIGDSGSHTGSGTWGSCRSLDLGEERLAVSQPVQLLHCLDEPLDPLLGEHGAGVAAELLAQTVIAQRVAPVAVEGVAAAEQHVTALQRHHHLGVHAVEVGWVVGRVLHAHTRQQRMQVRPLHRLVGERLHRHLAVQQRCAGVELERVARLVLRLREWTVDVLGQRDPQEDLAHGPRGHPATRQPHQGLVDGGSRIGHPVHPQVRWETLEAHVLLLQQEAVGLVVVRQWQGLWGVVLVEGAEA